MGWKVLVSAPYMQPVIGRFQSFFSENKIELVLPPVRERLSENELLHLVGDIDGVVCGDDRFTERVINAAPRLKVISKWGTGIDSIDAEACKKHGVLLFNTPNAFSEPVADSVMGYILCFARQFPWMDREMKSGRWLKLPGVALNESVVGIIGVGNVGKAVIRRAHSFGMKLLGCDLKAVSEGFLAETGVEMVDTSTLLREADYVSINCDLNPTSFHLLGESEISIMKPTSVVINTARGQIIDEQALVEALQQRRIAGAALDVFEIEPLPDKSSLRGMDNVLLAPHNSNNSPAAWERVHQSTLSNLLNGLKGRE